MVYKTLILLILWLPQSVRQLLLWTYWIQTKEYRFDRFRLLFASISGRENIELKLIFTKILLFCLSLILREKFVTVAFILLLFDWSVLTDLARKSFRKPVFTQRAKRISATAIILSSLPFLIAIVTQSLNIVYLILAELLLLLTPFVGVFLTMPIVKRVKEEEIRVAKARLSEISPTVIGITGSYGKSSTKDFVTQLLSKRFKVVKTVGSENTEFGIARRIKDALLKGTKFFVVEMGAYKIGEIKKLTDIVKPNVAILTGIEEQHLSLFGSLENIKKAKFELIEALPSGGIAIFNFSNSYCRELAERAKGLNRNLKVMGYYVAPTNGDPNTKYADIFAEIISVDTSLIKFRIYMNDESMTLSAQLPGIHFVENLAAAILVGRHFRVSWKEIKEVCRNIELPEKTMNVVKLKSGTILIDDTHNSTPRAFSSALKYLSFFHNKRKVVVTSGIIELGDKSEAIHRELGELMSETIDKIILTNPDFLDALKKGLGDETNKLIFSTNRSFLAQEINEAVRQKNTVLLLEGRLPVSILQNIEDKL